MPREMVKGKEECHGMHKKKGIMVLVLGLLVLANAYWSVLDWSMFVGLILVLVGLKLLIVKK